MSWELCVTEKGDCIEGDGNHKVEFALLIDTFDHTSYHRDRRPGLVFSSFTGELRLPFWLILQEHYCFIYLVPDLQTTCLTVSCN